MRIVVIKWINGKIERYKFPNGKYASAFMDWIHDAYKHDPADLGFAYWAGSAFLAFRLKFDIQSNIAQLKSDQEPLKKIKYRESLLLNVARDRFNGIAV